MGISVGLVGLGAFMRSFAKLYASHPLVDRVAFCDREADRVAKYAKNPVFAKKFREGDAYPSLNAICKSDLDALVIITQPWLHAPQCVQALESGKHVYSAVPIVSLPDSDEMLDWCDKLVKTVQKTGKHYMLGETTYYRPEAMYCRRRAKEGAFGDFVYAEGEYYHDVDNSLRDVKRHREASQAGQEWVAIKKKYKARGAISGPMDYPTHSTCGPICVMNAHATKVSCFSYSSTDPKDEPYFEGALANETALCRMSNNAVVRINEFRKVGHPGSEIFRVFGTEGTFREESWRDRKTTTPLTMQEMRDELPAEVYKALDAGVRMWNAVEEGKDPGYYKDKDFAPADVAKAVYGGHGGSHAFLTHEFITSVAEDRVPAINVWEAARYMALGIAAHRSALKDGELVDVADWGDAPK